MNASYELAFSEGRLESKTFTSVGKNHRCKTYTYSNTSRFYIRRLSLRWYVNDYENEFNTICIILFIFIFMHN